MSSTPEACILAIKHLCLLLRQTSKAFSKKTLCQAREGLAMSYGYPCWSELCNEIEEMSPTNRKQLITKIKSEIIFRDSAVVEEEKNYYEIRPFKNGFLEISTLWMGYTPKGYEVRQPRGLELTTSSLIRHRDSTGEQALVINSPCAFRLWLDLNDGSAMLNERIAKKVFRYIFENAQLDLISEKFDIETAKLQAELFDENFVRCTYILGSENDYVYSY
jgi:hypothetical protein